MGNDGQKVGFGRLVTQAGGGNTTVVQNLKWTKRVLWDFCISSGNHEARDERTRKGFKDMTDGAS